MCESSNSTIKHFATVFVIWLVFSLLIIGIACISKFSLLPFFGNIKFLRHGFFESFFLKIVTELGKKVLLLLLE